MAEVKGRPFLEWIMLKLKYDGFRSVLISTGYLGEVIEKYVDQKLLDHIDIDVQCVREHFPCGTAGGFLNTVRNQAVPMDGYLVINGDSLVLSDAGLLFDTASRYAWDAALFGLKVPDARRYGVLDVDAECLLKGFKEKGVSSGFINAGIYWFSRNCLTRFPDLHPLSFEYDVFPSLISGGARVGVVTVEAPFIDIGTPESMMDAGAFVEQYLQKDLIERKYL